MDLLSYLLGAKKGGGGGTTTKQVVLNAFVLDEHTPTGGNSSDISYGFKFSTENIIAISKFTLYPYQTGTADLHLSNLDGTDIASVLGASVVSGQWNAVVLETPVTLTPGTYVVWTYAGGGVRTGGGSTVIGTLAGITFIKSVSGTPGSMPTHENNSRYGINLVVGSCIYTSADYPIWSDIYAKMFPRGVSLYTSPVIKVPLHTPSWIANASQNVKDFIGTNCKMSSVPSSSSTIINLELTKEYAAYNSLNDLISSSDFEGLEEYLGYLYGTELINTYHMTLLGDFSQGGSATGNVLSDAITNYSAIALQGVYSKTRDSQYNTTIIYSPTLNTSLYTGMKDRNWRYACNVTFTDATTCSLSGNMQVIIYGIE